MYSRLLALALLLPIWTPHAQATHGRTAYPPPPVPECRDVIAAYGQRPLWVGEFSGKYADFSSGGGGNVKPYAARGCFLSEAECRRWLHRNLSYAGEPLYYMTCRFRAPGAGLY